ncbi:MAG: CapA family protein [Gammaproteobacteria bacterium]
MEKSTDDDVITLFVCGDVMTGRGIDQILPHHVDPAIHESYMTSALGYVRLAEEVNGTIDEPVDEAYIWGSALDELARAKPDARIINLETSVTTSEDRWPGKGIHYRMHPENVSCLTAARIDCCVLANNHVLDWGYEGLAETVRSLDAAALHPVGAGRGIEEAEQPAVLDLPRGGRVLVFAFGVTSSGIPRRWAATGERGGVNLLEHLGERSVRRVADLVETHRRERDLVLVSIHWGDNWGYEIPPDHRRFAHALIDTAHVDAIHGHSSHHPLAIEIYRERPILYGCGDLLNDYEGIPGYESFRGDLSLLYFLRFHATSGTLSGLDMSPQQVLRFRLSRPGLSDTEWLRDTLDRECEPFGCRVELRADGGLRLRWE